MNITKNINEKASLLLFEPTDVHAGLLHLLFQIKEFLFETKLELILQ